MLCLLCHHRRLYRLPLRYGYGLCSPEGYKRGGRCRIGDALGAHSLGTLEAVLASTPGTYSGTHSGHALEAHSGACTPGTLFGTHSRHAPRSGAGYQLRDLRVPAETNARNGNDLHSTLRLHQWLLLATKMQYATGLATLHLCSNVLSWILTSFSTRAGVLRRSIAKGKERGVAGCGDARHIALLHAFCPVER